MDKLTSFAEALADMHHRHPEFTRFTGEVIRQLKEENERLSRQARNWEAKYDAIRSILDPKKRMPEEKFTLRQVAVEARRTMDIFGSLVSDLQEGFSISTAVQRAISQSQKGAPQRLKPSELLADPAAWTQKAYARNSTGDMVDWDSPRAVCWCVDGAICRCHNTHDERLLAMARLSAIINSEHWNPGWNDAPERTHAEVLAALRKAGL